MPRYHVRGSPEIAAKLGAFPARRVVIQEIAARCYEIPENCIAIQSAFSVMIWPIELNLLEELKKKAKK